MTRHAKVLGLALALALTGCSGKSGDATGPDVEPPPINDPGLPLPNDPGMPPPNDPGPPPQNQGIPGSYVLEQINGSAPGQLVTLTNPGGQVIGLLRFDEASTLELDPKQAFHLALRYTDDKEQQGIDDSGSYDPAGPVSEDGWQPLILSSAFYGDVFTGVAQGNVVALRYDFDGDGQMDTSFGFRRAN